MDPRERVSRILNHKKADKVPIDFGGTIVTSIEYNAYLKLKNYLKEKNILSCPERQVETFDYTMGTVFPYEKIMELFKSDFRRVGLRNIKPIISDNVYTDGFGIKYKKAIPHEYFDVIHSPLANMSVEDLYDYTWPNPNREILYEGIKEKARDLFENTKYCIIADFGVPGFYETSQKLRGYEQFAVDLMINKKFVRSLFDILLKLQKEWFNNYLNAVAKYIQVVCYADDLGMEDTLQLSPKTYRELIKPYHREIFKFIKSKTGAKLMLHSCGDIYPLIGDFIEIDVDILNPVQVSANQMDPQRLKSEFGDEIIFWGGIDTRTLGRNDISSVIRTVKNMINVMGNNGGYVFAGSHNLQEDIPPENILAMFDAANKYGKYTLK